MNDHQLVGFYQHSALACFITRLEIHQEQANLSASFKI